MGSSSFPSRKLGRTGCPETNADQTLAPAGRATSRNCRDPTTKSVTPYVDLNQPGGLDWWDGTLYATRDVLGSNGSLVSIG